jgi:hypothetical protein
MSIIETKSTHILNASSNLVGFSFVILTSIKILKLDATTSIDDIATFAIMVFIISSFFSFLSIRTHQEKHAETYETIADYIFLGGLLLLFVASILLTVTTQ